MAETDQELTPPKKEGGEPRGVLFEKGLGEHAPATLPVTSAVPVAGGSGA